VLRLVVSSVACCVGCGAAYVTTYSVSLPTEVDADVTETVTRDLCERCVHDQPDGASIFDESASCDEACR
jgi:hypothetical protein